MHAPVAAAQRVMDIVAHHVADLRGAVRFFQQVAADGCGSDFWNVFVFRDREHLFLGQAAQGDTVLKADHAENDVLRERRRAGGVPNPDQIAEIADAWARARKEGSPPVG